MLVAPIKQGEGAIEHESPTGLIRFHQHGWRLVGIPVWADQLHVSAWASLTNQSPCVLAVQI